MIEIKGGFILLTSKDNEIEAIAIKHIICFSPGSGKNNQQTIVRFNQIGNYVYVRECITDITDAIEKYQESCKPIELRIKNLAAVDATILHNKATEKALGSQ